MGWTQEQQEAIDKRNSNILVAASAGSGKTAVLVERIIKRIIEENVDIDRLLIVTFTRAAASEMRERIENKIREKLIENPQNKHLRKQLKNIKSAYITTIDSFFFKVVQNNFYELSGIDPNVGIAEIKDVFAIKNRIFLELLEAEFEKENNEGFERVYNGICDSSDEKFKELIYGLHTYSEGFPYPDEWLEKSAEMYNLTGVSDLYETEFGKEIYIKLMGDIEIAIENMNLAIEYVEYDEHLGTKYLEQFEKDKKGLESLRNLENPSFAKLYEKLSYKIFTRMPNAPKEADPELKELVSGIRKKAKGLIEEEIPKILYTSPDKIVKDLNTSYEDAIYIKKIITTFREQYMQAKIKANKLEFNDIAHLALDMLIKREKDENGNYTYTETNVAKKYKEKFDEIYIDEYQDSNYIQEYALRAVSKVSEEKPNQFMVGDIKQSIYKFRNAVPDIFAQKYETYKETEDAEYKKIILAKNFRSRKEVLDGINYIFEQVMSKDAGECGYSGKEVLVPGASYLENSNQNYKTEFNLIELEEEELEEMEMQDELVIEIEKIKSIKAEAELIAKKINELVNEEKPFQVYDLKKATYRDIKYKDIVILLRNASGRNTAIEEVLNEAKIPCFSDKSEGLFNAEEVKFVITFLELLDNWYQDIPLAAMMYSIVGKFTLDEITVIRKTHKEGYLLDALIAAKEIENEIIKNKAIAFLDTLEKFTYYSKYYGISELIWKIYNETNIYEQFLLKENGVQKCANLDNLLNIAASFEKVDYKGLYHFIEYTRELNEKENAKSGTKEARVIGENANVVKIMTVHKSKGLEYPVVFLADTNTQYVKTTDKPEVNRHMKFGMGLDTVNSYEEYTTLHPSIIKQLIEYQDGKETISEELRCLYVALTRAKEKLIVVGTLKKKTKLEKKLSSIVAARDEKNIIKPNFVLESKSNVDLILLALKDDLNLNRACPIEFNHIIQSSVRQRIVVEEKEENKFQKFEEYVKDLNSKDITEYTSILEYEYPHKDSMNAVQKYSVSEIKRMKDITEEDLNNIAVDEYAEISVKVPKFLRKKEETKYSAAQKGSITHLILSYVDFKSCLEKIHVINLVDDLVKKDIITRKEARYIKYDDIVELLNSRIAKEARLAKEICKEKPFVYKVKPSENEILRNKVKTNDYILLQGIIDMYYIDQNDEIVLVDYKTDKVENELELVKKYKVQLLLYKEALENISNKKVKKVYIYSTVLKKEIEI